MELSFTSVTFVHMNKESLKTIQNFSREYGYSTSYIYRLIKDGKIKSEVIDGVYFIDMSRLPSDFKKK